MTRVCLLVCVMMGFSTAQAEQHRRAHGNAIVIDGDTLLIADITVHLRGLDAPELEQHCELDGESVPCGVWARDELARLVRGKTVSCRRAVNTTEYQGVCRAGGLDLNRELLKNGWALVNYHDNTYYAGYQSIARRKQLNLWSMSFEKPWVWREQANHSDVSQGHP